MLNLFGNPVVRQTEKKKRIEGEVEVLKKQQKVEIENVIKNNQVRQAETIDSINAEIGALKARISSLNKEREDKVNILREELKVEVDKVTNDFDRKIVAKQNKIKRLGYLIDADRKSEEDAINSQLPNAPTTTKASSERKVLNETVQPAKKSGRGRPKKK